MTVKIIPITDAYRSEYERIFGVVERDSTQTTWERPNGGASYVHDGIDYGETVRKYDGGC